MEDRFVNNCKIARSTLKELSLRRKNKRCWSLLNLDLAQESNLSWLLISIPRYLYTVTLSTTSPSIIMGGTSVLFFLKSIRISLVFFTLISKICHRTTEQNGLSLKMAGLLILSSSSADFFFFSSLITKLMLFYFLLWIVFVLCLASDCGCQNGGTCVHDATLPGGIMCVCAEGFSGILCATRKLDKLQ